MVREARQGREEAHRIRTEAFLIKKCAGKGLIYSKVSLFSSSKRDTNIDIPWCPIFYQKTE